MRAAASVGIVAGLGTAAFSSAASAASVTADVNNVTSGVTWQTTDLDNAYSDPVVLAGPVSYAGAEACHPRLRQVKSGSFDMKVEEWACYPDGHFEETIGSLVLESGAQTTDSGENFEVGTVTVTNTMNWSSVSFTQSISSPAVITTTQTINESDEISSRNYDVSSSGFQTTIQETHDGNHADETVGYLAIESGTGTLAGRTYEARTIWGVDDNWILIDFQESFDDPVFIANTQTINGFDTCELRYRNLTSDSVEVFIEEEECEDSETGHTTEEVSAIIIERQPNSVETDTRKFSINDAFEPHNRAWSFTNPVTVGQPLSYVGGEVAHPRLRNVTGNSFEAKIEEFNDDGHMTEMVSNLTLSEGAKTTASGTAIEAGTIAVSGILSWESPTFSGSFDSVPVVVSEVQTYNGAHPTVTRNKNVSTNGFDVAMQDKEGDTGHTQETVGWVAVEPGTGRLDEAAMEAGTVSGVDDTWTSISFQQEYNDPEFLADMQTIEGSQSSALRYRNLSYDGVDVKVDEENNDTHANAETVGYIVREGNPATLGGGVGYSDTVPESDADYKVSAGDDTGLKNTVEGASPGEIVYVLGDIDCSDVNVIDIPGGVTVASDRGIDGSSGSKLTISNREDTQRLFDVMGNDSTYLTRVTGLEIDGPWEGKSNDNGYHDSYGVHFYGDNLDNVRVDNCELHGWESQAIHVDNPNGSTTIQPTIEHCDFHHNQARTEGYGVGIYGDSDPLIRYCTFNYHRHAIACGTGTVQFTVENCWFGPGSEYNVIGVINHHGPYDGSEMVVRNSTIEADYLTGFEIQDKHTNSDGRPQRLDIENCWFYHPGDGNGNPPPAPGDEGEAAKCYYTCSSCTWEDLNFYWTNNHFGPEKPADNIGHPR